MSDAPRLLIAFYSAYGHVFELAEAAAEGARAAGADVRLRRFSELDTAYEALKGDDAYRQTQDAISEAAPEVTHDDLRWADGVVFGTPTRYGNMAAQMRNFLDSTAELWMDGDLEDKAAGFLVSTATIHGGHETTILTSAVSAIHLGMVFVGLPYQQNPHHLTTEGVGGSSYGASTMAGPDGSRSVREPERQSARNLGERVARVGGALRPLRERRLSEAAEAG